MTDSDMEDLMLRLWKGLPPSGTDLSDFTEKQKELWQELEDALQKPV